MKKILLFAIMAIPFLCAACSDDEDQPVRPDDVFGSWYETAYLCDDGYFVNVTDGRSYNFKKDMSYTYDDGYFVEYGAFSSECDAKIINMVSSEGARRSIVLTRSDADHAIFKTAVSTAKYERR